MQWAVVRPATGFDQRLGALFELGATLFPCSSCSGCSSTRGASWAAPAAGVGLIAGVVSLAGSSGAGLNPVRVLAPDLYAGVFPAFWIFVVGPMLGSVLAASVLRLGRRLPRDREAPT